MQSEDNSNAKSNRNLIFDQKDKGTEMMPDVEKAK